MTIVELTGPVTGGVDAHLDVHVAAAVDASGGVLGVESFETTRAGFAQLHDWLRTFGTITLVGVEGTGAYGAGLARYLRGQDLEVVEVDRPNRQLRRRAGKSDVVDAVEAARAALSGRASGIAKTADGNAEAIRALLIAKRSARDTRIMCPSQIRHLGFTALGSHPSRAAARRAARPSRRCHPTRPLPRQDPTTPTATFSFATDATPPLRGPHPTSVRDGCRYALGISLVSRSRIGQYALAVWVSTMPLIISRPRFDRSQPARTTFPSVCRLLGMSTSRWCG